MNAESQKEICQNVTNYCLCVLGLWESFLVFYIFFNQFICMYFKTKKKALFENNYFLAAAIKVL